MDGSCAWGKGKDADYPVEPWEKRKGNRGGVAELGLISHLGTGQAENALKKVSETQVLFPGSSASVLLHMTVGRGQCDQRITFEWGAVCFSCKGLGKNLCTENCTSLRRFWVDYSTFSPRVSCSEFVSLPPLLCLASSRLSSVDPPKYFIREAKSG